MVESGIRLIGYAALVAAALLAGCARPAPTPVAPPPPPPPPAVHPLDAADAAFEAGDYRAAAAGYESYLGQTVPGTAEAGGAEILYRLALIYSLPESPLADRARGRELFRELAERFPKSPFAAAAKYALDLQARAERSRGDAARRAREVEQLRKELEELKKIDLERRRPPR